MARAVKPSRSLWPKEHGAYGQLGVPLVAALAMGSPTPVAGVLVLAAVAAFAVHEPLLVLLGARGPRVKRDHGGRAARLAAVWAAMGTIGGGLGLWLGGRDVALAALAPVGISVVLAPLVLAGKERTATGELLASAALTGASLPVAIACAVPPAVAFAAWGAWVAAFSVSTAAVRWVITRHKQGRGERLGLLVSIVITGGIAALGFRVPVLLASLPMVLLGWGLMARPPHPRHLRRVGWTMVASSLLTGVATVVLVRLVVP